MTPPTTTTKDQKKMSQAPVVFFFHKGLMHFSSMFIEESSWGSLGPCVKSAVFCFLSLKNKAFKVMSYLVIWEHSQSETKWPVLPNLKLFQTELHLEGSVLFLSKPVTIMCRFDCNACAWCTLIRPSGMVIF